MRENHIQNAQVGWVHYRKASRLGPYLQPYVQLIYVQEGLISITKGKQLPETIEPGHAVFAVPGQRVSYTFAENTIHGWCEALLPEFDQPDLLAIGSCSMFKMSGALLSLVSVAQPYAWGVEGKRAPVRDALVRAVLTQGLMEAGFQFDVVKKIPAVLQRALDLIRAEPEAPYDLSDLASRALISESHLRRLFREHLGISAKRYIWQQRLQHAERLLMSTGMSVSEVGYSCGFVSPYHFSRRFKEKFGLSPLEFRRRNWQDNDAS